MKALAVIPVHGRIEVARITLINCKYLNVDTLIIGDECDINSLRAYSNHFVESNKMFPAKIDDGLQYASDLDHDVIIMIGCDDIISIHDHIRMLKLLSDGHDVVALDSCYFYDPKNMNVLLWPGYLEEHHRHGEPVGAFRYYLRSVLQSIDWTMYECTEKQMDKHSWDLATNNHNTIVTYCTESFDIKDAEGMTSLHAFDYLEIGNNQAASVIRNKYLFLSQKVQEIEARRGVENP
jgi:hypothetical protein